MKSTPWHSTERTEENEKAVYHDNTVCKIGLLIHRNQHRYGTDNRPLCKECSRLDEAGR